MKRRRLARTVVGYVRRGASVEECTRAGAVDMATTNLFEACNWADLMIFCTPISQMLPLARKVSQFLTKGSIVTDVGSVKGTVVRQLEPVFRRVGTHFVGSHPMAGSERMGVSAARPDLFEGATCVITPTAKTDPAALRKLRMFWKALGGNPVELAPAAHDRLVSRSSHLPQVLASALAGYVLERGRDELLCGAGFRDTTRLASSSPEMWRDIALANSAELGKAIDALIAKLSSFRRMLGEQDANAIHKFFQVARERREGWLKGERES